MNLDRLKFIFVTILTSYEVLTTYDSMRLRLKDFPVDRIQPACALGLPPRNPVKLIAASLDSAISSCTVVRTARFHHGNVRLLSLLREQVVVVLWYVQQPPFCHTEVVKRK